MGQLIKLEDYVSRYEQNIYHYPSRFVRLKKQQWQRTIENWSNAKTEVTNVEFWAEEEKTPIMNKLKGFLKLGPKEDIADAEEGKLYSSSEEDEGAFQFQSSLSHQIKSEDDLKLDFMNQLFRFQLKWASSTLGEKSYINTQYFYDEKLKFFIQRFPDNFLLLYRPIFRLKNAPIEAEIILISPTDTWCITFLEAEPNAVFQGANDHFWTKRVGEYEKKVLNPLISLNRTEKIIHKLYEMNDIELPIQKVVLCRNGYIDFPEAPYEVKLIEKRNFEEWFQAMRKLRSPLKHIQLKSAQVLLQYCQTSSYKRPEWETVDENDESRWE